MKKAVVRMKSFTKLTFVLFLIIIFILADLPGCAHMKYISENELKDNLGYKSFITLINNFESKYKANTI